MTMPHCPGYDNSSMDIRHGELKRTKPTRCDSSLSERVGKCWESPCLVLSFAAGPVAIRRVTDDATVAAGPATVGQGVRSEAIRLQRLDMLLVERRRLTR